VRNVQVVHVLLRNSAAFRFLLVSLLVLLVLLQKRFVSALRSTVASKATFCPVLAEPHIYIYIQGVSRLYVITAGGDFLGLCDEKSSYKHVSDFGRLRSYGRF
jgi:hypothetical protein